MDDKRLGEAKRIRPRVRQKEANATVRSSGRLFWVRVTAVASVVIAAALVYLAWSARSKPMAGTISNSTRSDEARYVGTQVCAGCHPKEYQLWTGSDHALAMREANTQTVLGNFNDANFRYAGITSVFSRHDGKFLV